MTATVDTTTHKLNFTGDGNQSIHVEAAGDTSNTLGFGAWQQGSSVTGAAITAPGGPAQPGTTLTLNVDGNAHILNVDIAGTEVTASDILGKITGDASYAALQAVGITASASGGNIVFSGNAGQAISVTGVSDAGNVLGYGTTTPTAHHQLWNRGSRCCVERRRGQRQSDAGILHQRGRQDPGQRDIHG